MPSHPASTMSCHIWRRRLRWLLTVGMGFGSLLLLINCSEQTRYKTLSFFFDGVPDPNAPQMLDGSSTGSQNASSNSQRQVRLSIHKPYQENDCNACHVGNMKSFQSFVRINSTVCMKCHKEVTSGYRYMHGPVAVGACLMCHDPHQSSQPHLIKVAPPKVCLQCHQRKSLGPPQAVHKDPKADCLSCHVGHGSSRHGLLRDMAVLPENKIPTPDVKSDGDATEPPDAHTLPTTPQPPAPASGEQL